MVPQRCSPRSLESTIQRQMSAFLDLPAEIILNTLEGCEYQGILACMLVRLHT